ncbi:hypothetical protein CNY89_08185 [Amaricoccus sp. HAR-UPW-R2A-40]|nr:hypothetical protein CNY89_08185 [Amaricoccus sp. HAR-UPW-R2A-40]
MSEVTIYEVGPRDGLQNEARAIPTAQKIALVDMLSATGLRRIEVTSFVSPRWIPQLADGAQVLAGIRRAPGVAYAVLVPNLKGFEAARASGVEEVAIFTAASETFSRRNINATIQESLERFAPVAEAAAAASVAAASRTGVTTVKSGAEVMNGAGLTGRAAGWCAGAADRRR